MDREIVIGNLEFVISLRRKSKALTANKRRITADGTRGKIFAHEGHEAHTKGDKEFEVRCSDRLNRHGRRENLGVVGAVSWRRAIECAAVGAGVGLSGAAAEVERQDEPDCGAGAGRDGVTALWRITV